MSNPARRAARTILAMALAALLPLAACSPEDREVTVLAAASLTGVFEQLATEFEDAHPGTDVRFSFGSSTTLAEQAVGGAPGDVIATADRASMEAAASGGALADDPTTFATNQMVLVVPAGNPAGITGLDDLAGTDWVRCDDDVPCGRLAVRLLAENGISAAPRSREIDVKATLAKVESNEADAGLVYATDAAASGGTVEVIRIPGAGSAPNPYLVSTLEQDDSDGLSREWIAFVTSERGRQVLTEAGFETP